MVHSQRTAQSSAQSRQDGQGEYSPLSHEQHRGQLGAVGRAWSQLRGLYLL